VKSEDGRARRVLRLAEDEALGGKREV
jgi:hypothetical protein